MNKMIKLLFVLASIALAIQSISAQCGCRPQKLLKRSIENMKIGDMLLDKNAIAILNGFKNFNTDASRWPNNQVLYMFNPSFPQSKRNLVKEHLKELQNDLRGCVQFIESNKGHYIDVRAEKEGCYSYTGIIGGPSQPLNLENPGCLSRGTVKHEFIHALGFMHTHMRKDRDNYIDIKWHRILTDNCDQFLKCLGCITDGPYETTSVMHYDSVSFACNPNEKVVLGKGGKTILDNDNTTPNDLQMIRNAYKCKT